jgi:vacuolar-type H+-ATPase subunit E/Vma4
MEVAIMEGEVRMEKVRIESGAPVKTRRKRGRTTENVAFTFTLATVARLRELSEAGVNMSQFVEGTVSAALDQVENPQAAIAAMREGAAAPGGEE